jgi:hypothetical protein
MTHYPWVLTLDPRELSLYAGPKSIGCQHRTLWVLTLDPLLLVLTADPRELGPNTGPIIFGPDAGSKRIDS